MHQGRGGELKHLNTRGGAGKFWREMHVCLCGEKGHRRWVSAHVCLDGMIEAMT